MIKKKTIKNPKKRLGKKSKTKISDFFPRDMQISDLFGPYPLAKRSRRKRERKKPRRDIPLIFPSEGTGAAKVQRTRSRRPPPELSTASHAGGSVTPGGRGRA